MLQDLSYQQIADLLLDAKNGDRRYTRITVTAADTSDMDIVVSLHTIVSFVLSFFLDRYPSVWPLSLLAFRGAAHALAFPRDCQSKPKQRSEMLEEFADNQHQSSLLHHIFRKHVKPKKQHEIRKLGMVHSLKI